MNEIHFNLYYCTSLFIYSLKVSENKIFSGVFREYIKRPMAWNGLSEPKTKIFSAAIHIGTANTDFPVFVSNLIRNVSRKNAWVTLVNVDIESLVAQGTIHLVRKENLSKTNIF